MKPLPMITITVVTILVGTAGSASATFNPIEPRPGKYQACPEEVWTEVCPAADGGIPVGFSTVSGSVTTTTATVRWQMENAADDEIISGFWVEVGTGSSVEANPIMLEGKGSDVREATITGLEPDTSYWISVEPVVPEPEYRPARTEVEVKTHPLSVFTRHAFSRRHIH